MGVFEKMPNGETGDLIEISSKQLPASNPLQVRDQEIQDSPLPRRRQAL
jgi:hypothetical protein